jgi:DNA-directed RNA polymerase subunit beta'
MQTPSFATSPALPASPPAPQGPKPPAQGSDVVRAVAKTWNDIQKKRVKEEQARQKEEQKLQELEQQITTEPDPGSVEALRLKQLKRVADFQRKQHERQLGEQMKQEADAVIDQLKQEENALRQQELEGTSTSPASKAANTVADENTVPKTGPAALAYLLANLDLDTLEAQSREILKSGPASKRDLAMDRLLYIRGLKRNNVSPSDLMITKAPVLPPQYRPYVLGDSLLPGDMNIIYKDLIEVRNAHREEQGVFGDDHSGESRLALYDALKASYGFGEPVNPKLKEKNVSGMMQQLLQKSPKYSFVQRKLLSKPQDNVGRSTIVPDPDLGMDELGVPEPMAWDMFSSYVQRRLVRGGRAPSEALKEVKSKTDVARKALVQEMAERPVVYSRAPAWHKFNTLGAYAKLIEGNALAIPPSSTEQLAGDFDGDQINVHVPHSAKSLKDVKEKLMASKQLISVRDPDKVITAPKHEQVLGLYNARKSSSGVSHNFGSRDEALSALFNGKVELNDTIVIDS